MKRTLMIVPRHGSGGASRIASQLSDTLIAYGVDLTVCYLRAPKDNSFKKDCMDHTINFSSKRSIFSLFKLRSALQNEYDNIILFGRNAALVYFLSRIGMREKRPNIIIWEGKSHRDAKAGATTFAGKYIVPTLGEFFYKDLDWIIGISEHEVAEFREKYYQKAKKIYTPALTHKQYEMAQENPPNWFRQWVGSDACVVGAGSLLPQKNFSLLIDAFALTSANNKDCKLIILGEGDERLALEEKIRTLGLEDRIKLPGYVDNPLSIIKECNCFVLSSDFEGLPGILIEALICGVNIVATDCPTGPNEILDGGRFGTIVPVGDAIKMHDAITEALTKDKKPNIPHKHLAQFEAETVVQKYLELLK